MKKRPSRSFRPSIECLENRLVPAAIAVTTFTDVVDPADGRVSLREAITQANATAERDTIVLATGTYRIGLAGPGENSNASGDFDVTNPLTIVGHGASATVIDGSKFDRLFEIMGTYRAAFSNLTLRNGGGSLDGGAIHALTANLRLDRCVVSGNRAANGGGINAVSGNVALAGCTIKRNVAGVDGGGVNLGTGTLRMRGSVMRNNLAGEDGGAITTEMAILTNSTVIGNSAGAEGGGIYALTAATLTRSTVSGNSAGDTGGISTVTVTLNHSTVSGNSANGVGGIDARRATLTNSTVSGNSGGVGGIEADQAATLTNSLVSNNTGGGIFSFGTVELTNSTVSGNSGTFGGGGIFANFSATLRNSTVRGNSADKYGGGLFATTATLTNCTVSDNSAGILDNDYEDEVGGGLFAGMATLTNCTVSGNSAGRDGGGIYANIATLTNCTITENRAHDGGGVYHIAAGTTTFTVKNTIIAQNYVDFNGTDPDVSGAFLSLGHNLIGDGTGSTGFGTSGDQVGTANNPLDARLAPLAFNGGRTQTHALLPGSRAIDRGDNTDVPAADQRGLARRKDGDGNGSRVVDIGAFER